MRIPVFVSCPSVLSPRQQSSRRMVLRELDRLSLDYRAIGRSDYPTEFPLHEVLVLARRCCGGLILGFEQFRATSGTRKRGTKESSRVEGPVLFPTPWNQIEAGILFSLGRPLLIFREPGLHDGVFDPGVTDVFIHKMPSPRLPAAQREALRAVLTQWQARVHAVYYGRDA